MQSKQVTIYRSAEEESASYLAEVQRERLAEMAWLVCLDQARRSALPHVPPTLRPPCDED